MPRHLLLLAVLLTFAACGTNTVVSETPVGTTVSIRYNGFSVGVGVTSTIDTTEGSFGVEGQPWILKGKKATLIRFGNGESYLSIEDRPTMPRVF